jgi:hypothetical protein
LGTVEWTWVEEAKLVGDDAQAFDARFLSSHNLREPRTD